MKYTDCLFCVVFDLSFISFIIVAITTSCQQHQQHQQHQQWKIWRNTCVKCVRACVWNDEKVHSSILRNTHNIVYSWTEEIAIRMEFMARHYPRATTHALKREKNTQIRN